MHGDQYSTAATAYLEATAQRMHHSPVVQGPTWSRRAILAAVLVSLAGNVAVVVAQVLASTPEFAIAVGIIVVVLLGAGGLVSRGIGELRNSPGWKASGCFLCGAAYLGTASVALANGVPLLFET